MARVRYRILEVQGGDAPTQPAPPWAPLEAATAQPAFDAAAAMHHLCGAVGMVILALAFTAGWLLSPSAGLLP